LDVPFVVPASGWPLETAGGVAFPNQALRMFIVSSSRPDFVLSCPVNGPGVQNSANNYGNPGGALLIDQLASWVKTVNPTTGFIRAPGLAVENWADNGHQFLHMKVVDLRPLFCRVTLTEYPIPIEVSASTAGSGYPPSTANNFGTIPAGFVFSFPSDTSGNIAVTEDGSFFSGTKTMIVRTGGDVIQSGTITGGSSATFTATLNNSSPPLPWWEISSPLTFGPQEMPSVGNTRSFYVIKGTALRLYQQNGSAPGVSDTPALSVQINDDSTFEYFNGSWTRID
jgi:hypothetical protein